MFSKALGNAQILGPSQAGRVRHSLSIGDRVRNFCVLSRGNRVGFAGAAVAVPLLHEGFIGQDYAASALMAVGVALVIRGSR